MKWHVVKYLIAGARLYAVEREDGYIDKYCDTLTRATQCVAELNTQ